MSDYVTNILSIWCFNNSKLEKKNLSKITNEFKEQAVIYGAFLRNSYFLQGISITIYSAFVLYILGYQAMHNLSTAGDFVLVFMVSYKIGDLLFTVAQEMLGFSQNCGAASSAIELLDFPVEIEDGRKKLKLTKGEIKFDHVKFSYNPPKLRACEAIQKMDCRGLSGLAVSGDTLEINITLYPGQSVGLVGYSGSGKSTFVNLIMRLYDATDGKVLIDGQNIKEITLDSLRGNIATIPQDPSLFHRSIMENIRYGKIDASDKDVMNAAKTAGAHEFIESLPDKYHTLVGERGIKLSGGQRQRIAIARAFLKNAPILILDEATSQLDSITEEKIQESLIKLMKEKTTIVVAHRLSTLLHMDRILVFDNGKIVEDGTRKSLLKQKGLYKTLWDAQVGGFLPSSQK